MTRGGWIGWRRSLGLEARLAALKAEAIAGHDAALHGVSADLGHRYPESGDRAAAPGERRWVAGDLRSVADEVALVLQLNKGAATVRIHTSCELVHNFPATLRALAEGELTERAAFTIVRELSVLEDFEDIRAAEAELLEWARKHPLQKIKQEAQAEAARRDPAARSKAHARAMEERSVRIFPTSDGTADIVHTQDAIDAAAVMTSLNRAAARRRRHGDPRTLDQLRADIALARLLPRTKQTTISNIDDPVEASQSANSPNDRMPDDHPAGGYTAGADTSGDHTARTETSGDRTADERTSGDIDGHDTDATDDTIDDTDIGADTTVIIHATGAELQALINGEPGTGGNADHHGPIPQSSLRKHLIRALTRSLLPEPATTRRHWADSSTRAQSSTASEFHSPTGGCGHRPRTGTHRCPHYRPTTARKSRRLHTNRRSRPLRATARSHLSVPGVQPSGRVRRPRPPHRLRRRRPHHHGQSALPVPPPSPPQTPGRLEHHPESRRDGHLDQSHRTLLPHAIT